MPRRRQAPRLYLDKIRRQWVIRDGPRFIRTGCAESNTKQAEIELAAYLGHKHVQESGPDPLIADVLLFYAREHLPHTKAKDKAAYNISSLAKGWGDRRISDITPGACREYAHIRRSQSARRDLEVLRAATRFYNKECAPLGILPSIIMPPKAEPRERWLTREEAKRLRRAAMKWPHLYRFVVIGLLTGSRSAVILNLQWSWVTLDFKSGNHLMLRRAPGEAEDQRKRTPPVRISARLARIMRRWKRDGCKYVIHYNGKPIRKIRRVWDYAVKAAGLGKDVTPHCLRRTRSTWLMQAGVDLWESAGHLGMSVEVLTRVYARHSPDWQKKASEV